MPPLPPLAAFPLEIEQFTKEKNALYNEYRKKKENVRELQAVKSNPDKILRRSRNGERDGKMNGKRPCMGYPQYRAARRLVHECCNYDNGNCILPDNESILIPPLLIAKTIFSYSKSKKSFIVVLEQHISGAEKYML